MGHAIFLKSVRGGVLTMKWETISSEQIFLNKLFKKLQNKYSTEISCILHTVSPVFNILHSYASFVRTNEPTLVDCYELSSTMLYLDFIRCFFFSHQFLFPFQDSIQNIIIHVFIMTSWFPLVYDNFSDSAISSELNSFEKN